MQFFGAGCLVMIVFTHLCEALNLFPSMEKSGKFEIAQTVTTGVGTKTMDIDSRTHKIYLPTAEFEEAKPGARPAAKPGTFMIVVIGRR